MTEERYDASLGSFSADPPNALDRTVSEPPSSESNLLPEIIVPTAVALRIERGIQADRARSVTVALTAEALWIQDVWQLRQVPLATLTSLEVFNNGKELLLSLRPEVSAERLRLTFDSAAEGLHWFNTLGKQQQQLSMAVPVGERFVPEGVTLVVRAPAVPHVILGPVGFTGRTSSSADGGLQLRAAMLGADAVFEVERWKCREMGWDARQARGVAVRVEDAIDRQRLRWCWFSENVCALVNRMLLLLAVQAVLLFLLGLFGAGASNVHAASGETRSEALTSAGQALALLYIWPLVILVLLRVLRRPELLRTAGLVVLAVTTGRGLLVMLVHGLVVQKTGSELAGKTLWLVLDPFDWAIIICGARLYLRAWRLASAARDILPPESQVLARTGRLRSRGLMGVTVLYAVALLGFVGYSRYQLTSFLVQPGVDTRREQEALLAFNDGRAHLDKADLIAAEKSFQKALRLFEQLTEAKSVPVAYRYNLFLTLWNLAWISERLDRLDEAESHYARAVTIGEAIVGHPEAEKELRNDLENARNGLASLRQNRVVVVLTEKDQTATRKYEEFQVKYKKEPEEAEKLLREAIALWEEVLPQATSAEYRKGAVINLATSHRMHGELLSQLGKPVEAEAALQKAIDYGEKAVAQAPDRPLLKQQLEESRKWVEEIREQQLFDEIGKLWIAKKYSHALDMAQKSISELEKRVEADKSQESAVRGLANRLQRVAYMLAHCPNPRVRDTEAAVNLAQRATQIQADVGDYWYTLALVQYRNDEWRNSLRSLEQQTAKEGKLDGFGWFLTAMNRKQLKQGAEARDAFRKGVKWIEERKQKAENDPLLRVQYESIRESLERLGKEAEALLEGDAVGHQALFKSAQKMNVILCADEAGSVTRSFGIRAEVPRRYGSE